MADMSEDERQMSLARFGLGGVFGCLIAIVIGCTTCSVYETYTKARQALITPLDDCLAHGGTYDARWSRCDPPKQESAR